MTLRLLTVPVQMTLGFRSGRVREVPGSDRGRDRAVLVLLCWGKIGTVEGKPGVPIWNGRRQTDSSGRGNVQRAVFT